MSQIDLVPTLLDLLGQPVPGDLPGKSLAPVLEHSGDARLDEDVCIEWNGPNNGLGDVSGSVQVPDWMETMAPRERIAAATRDPVRTLISPDGWKLNCSPLGEHELYDLHDDPGETRNRAADPEQRPRMQAMADRLRRWQDETNDAVALPRF
jgi:arylsulfatase A-like enzyme